MDSRQAVRTLFPVLLICLVAFSGCGVPVDLPTDYLVLVDLTYSVETSEFDRYLTSLQYIMQNTCDSGDFLLVYGFNEGQVKYEDIEFRSKSQANYRFPSLKQEIIDGRGGQATDPKNKFDSTYNRWTIFLNGCNAIWTDYSHREYSHQVRRRVVLVLSDCVNDLRQPFPAMVVKAVERVDWCFDDSTYIKFMIGINKAQVDSAQHQDSAARENLWIYTTFDEGEQKSFKDRLDDFQLTRQETVLDRVKEVGVVVALAQWLRTDQGILIVFLFAVLGSYNAVVYVCRRIWRGWRKLRAAPAKSTPQPGRQGPASHSSTGPESSSVPPNPTAPATQPFAKPPNKKKPTQPGRFTDPTE